MGAHGADGKERQTSGSRVIGSGGSPRQPGTAKNLDTTREMLSAPPSGVRVILSQFALALGNLSPTEQLTMFLAAPRPLRYWTFFLLDPNTQRQLLELMEAEAIRQWPAQEKAIKSFLIKTQAAYDRQRMPETPLNSSN